MKQGLPKGGPAVPKGAPAGGYPAATGQPPAATAVPSPAVAKAAAPARGPGAPQPAKQLPVQAATPTFEVVGHGEHGGALVREGRSLLSKPLARLSPGALVQIQEKAGERIRVTKVSGCGPEYGWISAKLVVEVIGQKADKLSQAFKGSSLLAKAEAQVEEQGSEKVLSGLAGKTQDGPTLVITAVAHLSSGQIDSAALAAAAAVKQLEGSDKKEEQASAALTLAAALLAQGKAREALGYASTALAAFKEVKDKQMEASAITTAANARLALAEVPSGLYAAKEAVAIFREIGDAEGQAAAESTLREAFAARDGPHRALANVAAEEVAFHKAKGDTLSEALVYQKLAEQQLTGIGRGGSDTEALPNALEALRLIREVGDKQKEVGALQTVADAYLASAGAKGGAQAAAAAEEAVAASKATNDKAAQARSLATLASAQLSIGKAEEAKKAAEESKSLALQLTGKEGTLLQGTAWHALAAAVLAASENSPTSAADAVQARRFAAEAATLFGSVAAPLSEAMARQTEAGAILAMGPKAQKAALEPARQAASLFQVAGDIRGEAGVLLEIAAIHLSVASESLSNSSAAATAATAALAAAERASLIFLLIGDKRLQSRARLAAAQGHLFAGDMEMGTQAAMQAVVLAREVGAGFTEATALRTAVSGLVARGLYAEGLRMAKEVRTLFRKLGSRPMEEAMEVLVDQLEGVLPHRVIGARTYVRPTIAGQSKDSGRSLFSDQSNCVMWTLPTNQMTYILYCLELLKLVDDLKNVTSKTSILVTTSGVMGRMTGEPDPCDLLGVMGATVWAVCRTVRLESPRLLVYTVDVPVSASPHEITECIRAAQIDAGPRGEISFVVDRKSLITGK